MASACTAAIMANMMPMIINSGRFINRVGRYVPCIEDSDMKYNWVSIYEPIKAYPSFNIGLCINKLCLQQQITQIINGLFISQDLPYRVYAINSEVENFQVPYSWAFYLIITILISLTLLTIASTIIKYKRMHTKKLVSYSALQQSYKVFSYKQSSLNLFNGLKAYSMLWVVFGHQYFFNLSVSSNTLTFSDTLLSPFFLFVQAGMLAVQIFLFVGGFFVGYAIVKEKSFSILKVPLAILNRMLRFLPSYFVAIFIFYSILMHLGSGPYQSSLQAQTQLCDHWWRSILFIDNLVDNGAQICMSWSWYLQIDMQLFIYSAIALCFYNKKKSYSILVLISTMVASLAFTMYMNYSHDFKQAIHLQDFGPDDTSFTDVYTKPWCRCSTYLYGILFSIFLYEIQQSSKPGEGHNQRQSLISIIHRSITSSKLTKTVMQVSGLAIMLFLILIPRTSQVGHRWSTLTNSLYLTFSKVLFTFGLSLLILPSLLGTRSITSLILDNKLTNFISKISFMVYLIHLNIIMQYAFSTKVQRYYSISNLFVLFIGHAVISCVLAAYLVVIVEIPFYKMQKHLMAYFQGGQAKNSET